AFQTEVRLAEAGSEARAEDLQLAMLIGESELDAVPVDASDAVPLAGFDRRRPEPADMLDHLCEIVVGEHRDVSEHVVKAVGCLEIVELLARADEIPDRKHPLTEHCEEDVVRHQPGYGNRSPP